MRKRILSFGLCLALCLGLCACAGNGEMPQGGTPSSQEPVQTAEPTPEAKEGYAIGEQAEVKGVTVTLTQVEESTGSQFFEPEDGKVFLLCHFDIANGTEEDLAVSSMLSFSAYVDDYAASISLGALAASSESQLDGSVAAGKKLAGVVGYEVDKDWSKLEITFKPSVWSGKGLTFIAEHS